MSSYSSRLTFVVSMSSTQSEELWILNFHITSWSFRFAQSNFFEMLKIWFIFDVPINFLRMNNLIKVWIQLSSYFSTFIQNVNVLLCLHDDIISTLQWHWPIIHLSFYSSSSSSVCADTLPIKLSFLSSVVTSKKILIIIFTSPILSTDRHFNL